MDKAMLCPKGAESVATTSPRIICPLPEQRCHGGSQACLVAVQILALILRLPR